MRLIGGVLTCRNNSLLQDSRCCTAATSRSRDSGDVFRRSRIGRFAVLKFEVTEINMPKISQIIECFVDVVL